MEYYLLAKLMVTFCRNRCCHQVQAMGDRTNTDTKYLTITIIISLLIG